MRHYELVLLVHPDQSDQVPEMINRYQDTVKKNNGIIHRSENIGRLQLAYTIENMHKAHYVIMNIECDGKTLAELSSMFKFSDAVIRHLMIRRDNAIIEPSPLAKSKEENREEQVVESVLESEEIEGDVDSGIDADSSLVPKVGADSIINVDLNTEDLAQDTNGSNVVSEEDGLSGDDRTEENPLESLQKEKD